MNTATSTPEDITNASPHRLISLLFERLERAIADARLSAEQGNATERGNHIAKAVDIIANGLKVSLNPKEGGEIAEHLANLYDYMVSRLLWANIKNDIPALDEVKNLLEGIVSAWRQIDPDKQAAA